MRYLCLFYIDQNLVDAGSKEEWAEIDRESLASNEKLKRSGHYVASNALADPRTAKTLRVRAGKASWTDGPFAETKEYLGRFPAHRSGEPCGGVGDCRAGLARSDGGDRGARDRRFLAAKCTGTFYRPSTAASIVPIRPVFAQATGSLHDVYPHGVQRDGSERRVLRPNNGSQPLRSAHCA